MYHCGLAELLHEESGQTDLGMTSKYDGNSGIAILACPEVWNLYREVILLTHSGTISAHVLTKCLKEVFQDNFHSSQIDRGFKHLKTLLNTRRICY